MTKLHAVLAAMLIILATPISAETYDYMQVERFTSGGASNGVVQLPFVSSNESGTEHTYRADPPTPWPTALEIAELIHRDANGGEIKMSYVLNGTYYETDWQAAGDLTQDGPDIVVNGTAVMLGRRPAGPIKPPPGPDGIAEPRDWIDVRIQWQGANTNGLVPAGVETIRLTNNGGTYSGEFTFAGPNAQTFSASPSVTWIDDNTIDASTGMTEGPYTTTRRWGHAGVGIGDYTGPLTEEADGLDGYQVIAYAIVALGPTTGGPGDYGIQGDPDGGYGDGEGDGGGDPDDVPPDREEDPEVDGDGPTGLDCVDEKIAEAEDILNIDWLEDFASAPQQPYIMVWQINAGFPDFGPYYFTFRSDFNYNGYPELASAGENVRTLSRLVTKIAFTIWGLYVTFIITMSW